MSKIILFIFALLSATSVENHKDSTINITTTPSVDIETVYKLKEFEELKIENKIMKEFHEKILDTVYWSLGSVFGILALLLGFGWWSNFKLHEKDKKSILDEVSALISEREISQIKKIHNVQESINSEIKSVVIQLNSKIDNLHVLHSEVDKTTDELYGQIETVKASIADCIKHIKISHLGHEVSLRFVEERLWDTRGVGDNVLLTQFQYLSACIELNKLVENEGRDIGGILERIAATIQESFIDKKRKVSQYLLDVAKNDLKELDEKHNISINKIFTLLEEARTIDN
ncbi:MULTISPECIES: hypothetical protein [Aeromonas]|uniref:hypothetical protein n=1 Tax=Aeromonas TaxID=642 RepID=UPI001D09A6AA|nr:hypothetical protein [Aeromonas veronii]UDN22868.1 hypothetical protein LEO77_20500 [Aeromonas veronii]